MAGCLYEMIGAICCLSSEMPFLLVMRGKQFSYLALKCDLEGSKETAGGVLKKCRSRSAPKRRKKYCFARLILLFNGIKNGFLLVWQVGCKAISKAILIVYKNLVAAFSVEFACKVSLMVYGSNQPDTLSFASKSTSPPLEFGKYHASPVFHL
ncbi:hypothetical protein Mettu_1306 [Methylobacter tundripaludum SV96]|uniref:Uncharacterized protein n=1 Tax=Methylobacter tundripaludum (strain ATCC BAA-1195 / DSM 17260 / SV96) TaxID=697282 RepID=G3IT93_METTV|nr:hypothetical protein Mettu_1306 [Methylobacter tundripaludum SV96]